MTLFFAFMSIPLPKNCIKWSEVTCGQVWWSILGICALHLTHPHAHTQQWTHTHTMNTQQWTHTPWTHSSEHTHTMNTHPEQWAANATVPGEVRGFGALLKGLTSDVVLKVERALLFTPPTDNSCRTWDLNPQPSGYKSDSLSIRPRLPPQWITP